MRIFGDKPNSTRVPRMRTLILLVLTISIVESNGQDLKRKTKCAGNYYEVFYVLKENKDIRHGQYIKYYINSLKQRSIAEMGHYHRGHKSEKWYYFSTRGYLKEEGQYLNDLKEGLWFQYLDPVRQDSSTLNVIGSAFEVNQGIIIGQNGEVEIDRSDILKFTEGNFHRGKKIGPWNYYSRDGSVVHVYDHSTDSLLANNDKAGCPFLGGYARFQIEFRKFRFDSPDQDTKAAFKIIFDSPSDSVETVECIGDCRVTDELKKILQTLIGDFIEKEGEEIQIDFSYDRNEGRGFHKYEVGCR